MHLAIRNIPNDGLDLDFEIPAVKLVATLPDTDPMIDAFKQPTKAVLNIQRVRDNVTMNGSFAVTIRPSCDRCLVDFDEPLKRDLNITCVPAHKIGEEDEGVYPYDGDRINLAALVRDQLLLTLPMVFHCSNDCKGLCGKCGINLNQEDCNCINEAQVASNV